MSSPFLVRRMTYAMAKNTICQSKTILLKPTSAELINAAMMARVDAVNLDTCDVGSDDSFFVCDLAQVRASYALWHYELPMVRPFYAVKCNTDRSVIHLLATLGAGFDCASKYEIDVVTELGISPKDIVYANPCKTISHVRHSRQVGVGLTTIDNSHEIFKLKAHHPNVGVLIRIKANDSSAQCELLNKFGCSLDTAISELLPLCKENKVKVRGVAFHVGLGAVDFSSFSKAIRESRLIFDSAKSLGIDTLDTLDIGGGFTRDLFIDAAVHVRTSLAEYFDEKDFAVPISVIAEPGRFMTSHAFSLATHVISRRDQIGNDLAKLYINDGVYNNLNCTIFDHYLPLPRVLKSRSITETGEHWFSVWGQTCDGLDCVTTDVDLGQDVRGGDWLCFDQVGAYTSVASSHFNGFNGSSPVMYIDSSL